MVAERHGLRSGWTTGTCAAAAAKAAAASLVSGHPVKQVEVGLPGGSRVSFTVEESQPGHAVVVKDAGDDPDCTDGARMTADLSLRGEGEEPVLHAGSGVGTVTKPGLGLEVGAPAINPVPRRMIRSAVAEVTRSGFVLWVSVPDGEQMAKRTTNTRLGIVGGISVLGTTGIVRPFSTAAYRASVVQQVDVAAAQGERTMVLATGSRSEQAALRMYPELDEVCFVEVGDYTGVALRRAAAAGMASAVLVAMAGKITKLAAGVMMTHFHRSRVDNELMVRAATATSAPPAVVESAGATATARHFFETCVREGFVAPLRLMCEWARGSCEEHTGGKLAVSVKMTDFEGSRVVASA